MNGFYQLFKTICLSGIVCFVFLANTANTKAQTFCFSKSYTPYIPISGSTSLNGTRTWDDTTFFIKVGFPFTFMGKTYDSVTVESNGALYFKNFSKLTTQLVGVGANAHLIINDTLPTISFFGDVFHGMNMADRGLSSHATKSTISYLLSGASPNRVLSIEFKNAGFKYIDSILANDSMNVQIRLFESSNAIEYHFGDGHTTDTTLFANTQGALVGLGMLDTKAGSFQPNGYFLSGDTTNPVISFDDSKLKTLPSSNTVYHFTPSPINASVAIVSNTNPICATGTVIFTATVSGAGASPVYQWQVNKILQGSDSSKFYGIGLSHLDTIRCLVTPAGLCATGLPTVSNNLNALKPIASVKISISKDTSCYGDSLVFIATPINGGIPIYSWMKNNTVVGTNDSTYKDNSFNDLDTVYCIVTSSLPCIQNSPASSAKIAVHKLAATMPSLFISANTTTACSNDSVLFTAAPLNGGNAPSYQWKINGTVAGANKPVFTAKNLVNGARVSCVMTSNKSCVSTATVPSTDTLTINVISVVAATLVVKADTTTICLRSKARFTANYTLGGTTPSFQWKINGVNTGTDTAVFITPSILNNNQVTCVMTSAQACVGNSPITSNAVSMNVISIPATGLSITSLVTQICSGDSLVFTATPTGKGLTPVYGWNINTTYYNVNDTVFKAKKLSNGDYVFCVMQSSLHCKAGSPDTSAKINITVPAITFASMRISPDANPICAAGTIHFTSTFQNQGANPHYQWKRNGVNTGTDSPLYTLAGFNNLDKIYCVLTSDKVCVKNNPAYSDTVLIKVLPTPTSSIAIAADKDTACMGEKVSFTSSVLNPGASPAYQWKHNTLDIGVNTSTYSASNFVLGDSIWCELTTGFNCQGTVPTSNSIKTIILGVPGATVSITSSANQVCKGGNLSFIATSNNGGTNPLYKWYVNHILKGTNAALYSDNIFHNADLVRCDLVSGSNCKASSNVISVTVNPVLASVSITADKTTICNGDRIIFTAQTSQTVSVYKWLVNNAVQSQHGNTLSITSLANNDRVSCVADFGGGCIDTSNALTVTVKIICLDAIEASMKEAGIEVYPNPATDFIEVSVKEYINCSISLFDFTGREVRSLLLNADKTTLSLSELPKGIYIMQLKNDKGVWLKKIMCE